MFIIGVDPHKGSHTAAVLDRDEQLVGQIRVRADRAQRDRLLAFASAFEPRLWAIEGATGTGALLAQQLVGAGEALFFLALGIGLGRIGDWRKWARGGRCQPRRRGCWETRLFRAPLKGQYSSSDEQQPRCNAGNPTDHRALQQQGDPAGR